MPLLTVKADIELETSRIGYKASEASPVLEEAGAMTPSARYPLHGT